jgi:hypothetical protein
MKKARGKTGPTTEQGKQISSRNASKHNCTSTSLIVNGESPAEFASLLENLTAEYQPETEMQQIIVKEAARAIWELARVNREFDKSQQQLYLAQSNMHEWNTAQQAEFERMLRYRTKAERAYGRAWQRVEYLRKLRLQAQNRAFWENLQDEKMALSKQRLKLSADRMKKTAEPKEKGPDAARPLAWPKQIAPLSQLIEVRLREGVISIRVHPLDRDMRREADMVEAGAQVLRRFEFPDGIPAEYAWVNEPDIRHRGIVWEQHFESVQAWRAHVEKEAALAPGHFLPRRIGQV